MNFDKILQMKLAQLFPDERGKAQAVKILSGYGRVRQHQEITRVHLAILKLSGSDLELLKHHVQVASTDYRDILYWAEHSRESGLGYQADADSKRVIRKQDAAEYNAWLKEEG